MAAFASSYIKTVASQVTRAADAASMTGANFSSWYNAAEGTLYLESVSLGGVAGGTFGMSDGTNSNRFWVQNDTRLDIFSAFMQTNGVIQSPLSLPGVAALTQDKVAMAYQTNDRAATRLGGSVVSATSSLIPNVDRALFNRVGSSTAATNSAHIRKLSYYPVRVTNAQLTALTS